MKIIRLLSAILAAIIVLALTGCGTKLEPNRVFSTSDMPQKTVGVIASAPASGYLTPFAGEMTVKYYSNVSGVTEDLISGVLDCAVTDKTTAEAMVKENSTLKLLEEPFVSRDYHMAVSQDNVVLRDNINAALNALVEDGTLDSITSGWLFGEYEYPASENTVQGTLDVAIDPTFPPYCFSGEDGAYLGMEIDIIRAVCDRLGVELNLVRADAENILYLVESGKVSLAIGRIVATEEAAVIYTDTYLTSMQVIVVRDS